MVAPVVPVYTFTWMIGVSSCFSRYYIVTKSVVLKKKKKK